MRLLKTIITLLCTTIFSTNAAMRIDEYRSQLPAGTNLSMLVQQVDSKQSIVNYNSDQLVLPASTQKVVTALAAMLELGAEYRFNTQFEGQSEIISGKLSGPLIIRFTGDPTLTRQQIRKMVKGLANQGLNTVTGDLLIDTSVFSSHDKAPGWSWNNLTQCYSAAPSATIIDKNCFSVVLKQSSKNKSSVISEVSPALPINVSSDIKVALSKGLNTKYCELDVVAQDQNNYHLTGCLSDINQPIALSFAVQDSLLYAGQIIRDELEQAGIRLQGRVKQQSVDKTKTIVFSQTQSAPLNELLTIMLKQSDNMIADALFRTLGNHYYDVPGTWRSGGDAVRDILRKKAGINLGNAVLADGSGLSRNNLISASSMMQILYYIAQHDKQLQMIEMLPIAGEDGTLKMRKSLKDAGVTGKLVAKTGALQGVYNLVGFMTTASGKQIAFVQLLSSYSPPASQAAKTSLSAFESSFYRALYTNN